MRRSVQRGVAVRVNRLQGEKMLGNRKIMLATTQKAIETVAMMDPSIDRARLAEGLRVIAGEVPAIADAEEDRPVSRSEAARLLGVCWQTVCLYARRGIIRRVHFGAAGARASGYSLRSIREAIATR